MKLHYRGDVSTNFPVGDRLTAPYLSAGQITERELKITAVDYDPITDWTVVEFAVADAA